MKTIGERIKARREELGMSQDELAVKIGYKSRSSINKIELGGQQLTQRKVKAIADALKTDVNYVLGIDEDDALTEQQICDLFSECHGKEAYKMVQSFMELDQTDRNIVYGEVLGMLKADKYTEEESDELNA